jgi:ABC-2 type transport system ATP-binding protein
MAWMIELEHLTKLYGTVLGVNDMTLQLTPGAWGLLGPNGAGKSTLLNLLIGQLRPTRGVVRVLGENPRNNARLMRRIGFCPAFEGMYAGVSGLEWTTWLLQLQGFARKPARQRAAECMERVGMAESMLRPISSYSRGMRQRTKLAQAISHDPELLILDEPLSGLDPVGRAQMTALLRDWIAAGRSVLIASHVLHEIEALTQSFLLVSGGRLLASGTAAEVHELLFQVPMEIQVRCSAGRRLSALAIEQGAADAVRLQTAAGGGDLVQISTRNAAEFSRQLAKWVSEEHMVVYELRSADDSLQSLFHSLMKIHRGEL